RHRMSVLATVVLERWYPEEQVFTSVICWESGICWFHSSPAALGQQIPSTGTWPGWRSGRIGTRAGTGVLSAVRSRTSPAEFPRALLRSTVFRRWCSRTLHSGSSTGRSQRWHRILSTAPRAWNLREAIPTLDSRQRLIPLHLRLTAPCSLSSATIFQLLQR